MFADFVFRNGRIATQRTKDEVVEAMATRDQWVLAVGANESCDSYIGPTTRTIDLNGRFVMPGICDSHCHPDGEAAKQGRWRDLAGRIGSRAELLEDIAAYHSRADALDEWYLGYRFDDVVMGGYPTLAELEAAAPGRPVLLLRRDAQVAVANPCAWSLFNGSGLSDTALAEWIDHRTGVARGRGVFAIMQFVSRESVEDYLRGFPAIFEQMARFGITGVHNALTSAVAVQAYRQLHARQALPVRVGMMLNGRDDALVTQTINDGDRFTEGDEQLYLLGVEYGSDGSTSGRTAAYYAPYTQSPESNHDASNRGRVNFTSDDLAERVDRVMAAGLQVAITGNGDRGIDFALDALEHGLKKNGDAVPPRIEHCCAAPPPIQSRMARLGIIDASASGFAYSLGDAYRVNRPISDHDWLWPHRSMIDAGVLVCGHSDAPVCDRNPFLGMWSMVSRATATGWVLGPAQAISIEEAVRCYTFNPAIAEGKSHLKGCLAPDRLADFVILDTDLYRCDTAEIKTALPLVTIVGGAVTYARNTDPWVSLVFRRRSDA